jgi:hypothetical protein
LFGEVEGVGRCVVPAAQGVTIDGETLTLQRGNFAPDEGVAHLRVLVDEVGNAQADVSATGNMVNGSA